MKNGEAMFHTRLLDAKPSLPPESGMSSLAGEMNSDLPIMSAQSNIVWLRAMLGEHWDNPVTIHNPDAFQHCIIPIGN